MGEFTFDNIIKKSILELETFQVISVLDVLFGTLMAFIIGMFIFLIYKKSFKGVVYSRSFNVALVMMCLITNLIIMTISSNVVLSLGMVGALSIVRFRTALKDPMDIIFMFWAISAGIASGAGIYPIAVIGSLCVGAVLLLLSRQKFSEGIYLLIIHYNENASDAVKLKLNKLKFVLKSKTVTSDSIELTVEIRVKRDNTAILNEFSTIEGVKDAVLVSYNGEYAA